MRPLSFARSALLWSAIFASGCNSATGPSSPDGSSMGEATLDPNATTFVLALADDSNPNRPVRVDLVGRNLNLDDAEETISIDIAIVNRGPEPLGAPGVVRIGDFRPPTTTVTNPDVIEVPNPVPGTEPPTPLPYLFDYTDQLGDDGLLSPGETSGAKTWVFHDPGLGAFSFAARADFGLAAPGGAHIGGVVFHDANRNGRREANEGPGWGAIEIGGPSDFRATAHVNRMGQWHAAVEQAGLYRVTFFDPTDGPEQWIATTPNPLEVVLPPGPDGEPTSFDEANFGAAVNRIGGDPPPIVMTDRQPDEIEQDPYRLIDAALWGDVFHLRVHYGGGCRPEHPLVLFASGDFRESNPVQTWMVLAHDDLGDPCEALITRSVAFDLAPIRRAHVEAYGAPGLVILHLLDFEGNRHTFEFGP